MPLKPRRLPPRRGCEAEACHAPSNYIMPLTPPSSRVAQNYPPEMPHAPFVEEARLSLSLCIAAYLGEDLGDPYEPSLFDPKTRASVPKGVQDQGLAHVLETTFGLILDHFINVAPTDTQGFIAHDAEKVVLVYRGSTSVTDWITNANVFTTPWEPLDDGEDAGEFAAFQGLCHNGPRLHLGHYNAFLSTKRDLEEVLIPQIQNAVRLKKHLKVFICGHSLGGSLATMALAYILERMPDELGTGYVEVVCTTLGAPSVGNASFVDRLTKLTSSLIVAGLLRVGRYINNVDFIPASLLHLFQHFGPAYTMSESGKVDKGLDTSTSTEAHSISRSHTQSTSLSEWRKDHKVKSYRDVFFLCEEELHKHR